MPVAGLPHTEIAIVVAVADNGVIGRDGGLPWRFKADLQRFRAITMDKPVVMGRTTFESIGKALKGRDNIVLSSRDDFQPQEVTVARNLSDALEAAAACAQAKNGVEICVIGGAALFRETLPLASRLYVTHIEGCPAGDVHFSFPAEDWRAVSTEPLDASPGDTVTGKLVVYEQRRGAPA